ncbi:alcohol dehydrogenase catalytic domain-containing protein [Vulcanisaeta distributa]|uniref:alcohol dehydrogenase catalytic domain-containing protein n=1 Tax=Vulcanisaeta distributa TaxID=164451 RepID=UPI001FB1DF8D|nr:alcohol dehydrogenase catalytic domain-containing protein [Vulcanisaeta distributa]
MKAEGICGRDLVIWRGGFRNLKPPLILGHEIFGEIDGRAVGGYLELLPMVHAHTVGW